MSFCTQREHLLRLQARHERLRYHGWTSPALLAYDIEHEWRMAGEPNIRLEMERRLALRYPVILPAAG